MYGRENIAKNYIKLAPYFTRNVTELQPSGLEYVCLLSEIHQWPASPELKLLISLRFVLSHVFISAYDILFAVYFSASTNWMGGPDNQTFML
jgi:hypothetical protein